MVRTRISNTIKIMRKTWAMIPTQKEIIVEAHRMGPSHRADITLIARETGTARMAGTIKTAGKRIMRASIARRRGTASGIPAERIHITLPRTIGMMIER
jgi:hypothetical protein